MACVKKRRGKWVCDWRDGAGVRHWRTFDRKVEADTFRDKVGTEARQRLTPTVPATIKVQAYADHWKVLIASTVKRRTLQRYDELLRLHLLPRFGACRVQQVERGQVKLFLAEKLNMGLEKRTVRNIQSVFRAMLNAAIEDGVIASNPASKLGRTLNLTVSKATVQEEVKAMDKQQRQLFLATTCRETPRYYPLFFVLAGTGMRLGEALALQPEDIDCSAQTIRIARAFSEDGTLDTPKNGHGRTVDLSQSLTDTLAAHETTHKQEKLKFGWDALPPWLFVTKAGTPLDPANVRRSMQSLLKKATLPLHFTPHGLRHTYASILLADGVSPVYVQEQLGHATIELTVSTYGRWLKKRAPGALDRLDAVAVDEVQYLGVLGRGSKVVAEAGKVGRSPLGGSPSLPYIQALRMEPAIRIERTTCGLRNRCSTN